MMSFDLLNQQLSTGKINYYKAGSGPPVLYLHSENGFINSKVLENLSKKFEIFAPIIPGFEGTENIVNINSIEKITHLMSNFIEETIGVNKVDIIGHSIGGTIASKLLVDFPNIIDQIVLISPYGFQDSSAIKNLKDFKSLFKYPEKILKLIVI